MNDIMDIVNNDPEEIDLSKFKENDIADTKEPLVGDEY